MFCGAGGMDTGLEYANVIAPEPPLVTPRLLQVPHFQPETGRRDVYVRDTVTVSFRFCGTDRTLNAGMVLIDCSHWKVFWRLSSVRAAGLFSFSIHILPGMDRYGVVPHAESREHARYVRLRRLYGGFMLRASPGTSPCFALRLAQASPVRHYLFGVHSP